MEILGDTPLVTEIQFDVVLDQGRVAVVDHGEDGPVVDDDFLGSCTSCEIELSFPGCGIQDGQRGFEAECDIDAFAVCDESSSQLCGAAFEWPEVAVPVGQRLFPENRSVESVTGDEFPVGRELDRDT